MKNLFLLIAVIMIFGSCSRKLSNVYSDTASGMVFGYPREAGYARVQPKPIGETSQVVNVKLNETKGVMPKATAFKMNGDYSDKVAVTLDAQGDLIYFPGPTDININSMPVDLGNGWWLNRQGIGPGSVFTTYTFQEYSNLPKVPSADELKAAIIPGAVVTEFIELPFNASEANIRIDEIKEFLAK